MATTPPTFNPAPTKSGSKLWLWLILALVAFCALACGGIAFFFKSMMGSVEEVASCMMSGQLASKSVLAYALDHEGQLPPAETWQDDIRPYYDRLYEKTVKQFDEVPDYIMEFDIKDSREVLECDWGTGVNTGFAYNSTIAGTNTEDYERMGEVILIFETLTPRFNANGNPEDRPDTPPDHGRISEKDGWINIMMNGKIDGEDNPFESSDMDMSISIDPEDGLPPLEEGSEEGSEDEDNSEAEGL